jgi:hypothetical protein
MFDLITAARCLKMLKDQAGIKYSKSYFSQMVKEGRIPFHHKPDSPKKFFKYSEVLQAIEDSKDPTRDAQREANAKKREKEENTTLLDIAGSYKSAADMTQEEKEAEKIADKKALEEAEAAKREALEAGASEDEDIWQSSIPEGITQAEAKAEKEYWLGRKAELEFKKMNKELISVDEVEREAFEIAKGVRDAFLALPARLAPILAADSDQFSIQNKLTLEINDALESLSHE